MPTISITIGGQSYDYAASDAQVAALGAIRASVMGKLPPGEGQTEDTPVSERPGYIATDAGYLEASVAARVVQHPEEDPAEVMARALASWAGQPAPEPTVEPLSPEAETARRVAGIKQEAQRRIVVLTGANDLQSCVIKQLNALMRAGELTAKLAQGGTWTAEETAEAATLQNLADAVKAVRAKSDKIELNPPEDWTNSAYWN